jgi:hypothetical protein
MSASTVAATRIEGEPSPPPRPREKGNVVTVVRRPPSLALAGWIMAAAVWGWVVDSPLLPILRPTGNSTLFQSTTAGSFALLGILFGPLAGALGGLVRDGTGYLLVLAIHPSFVIHHGFEHWLGRAFVDTFEDVMLGWLPGLVAARVRRLDLLALVSAASAWISLPFLIVGYTIVRERPDLIWHVLTTPVGDWNEPVDPGLTVYALLTGALVCFTLTRLTSHPRRSLLLGLAFALPALGLILLEAHY